MQNDLEPKFFHALLNGLIKKRFYHDADITSDFLKKQLFGNSRLSPDKIDQVIMECDRVLNQAATQDWSLDTLQRYLVQTDLTKELSDVFNHIWKMEKPKIHNSFVNASVWSPTYSSLLWRIDVKTNSKANPYLTPDDPAHNASTEPTAFVELALTDCTQTEKEGRQVLQFEVDRLAVSSVVNQLDIIQKHINQYS